MYNYLAVEYDGEPYTEWADNMIVVNVAGASDTFWAVGMEVVEYVENGHAFLRVSDEEPEWDMDEKKSLDDLEYIEHEVEQYDTLSQIAEDNNSSVDAIVDYNDKIEDKETVLQIGWNLIVPILDDPDEYEPIEEIEEFEYAQHVVEEGDNISKIAIKYNSSINAIVDYNDKIEDKETVLQIGWNLIVPILDDPDEYEPEYQQELEPGDGTIYKNEEGQIVYVVIEGDYLGAIAENWDEITWKDIALFPSNNIGTIEDEDGNEIPADSIYPGQELIIPLEEEEDDS